VNLANELGKITFSKFSVMSFLTKPLSDPFSDLTTHSQQPPLPGNFLVEFLEPLALSLSKKIVNGKVNTFISLFFLMMHSAIV